MIRGWTPLFAIALCLATSTSCSKKKTADSERAVENRPVEKTSVDTSNGQALAQALSELATDATFEQVTELGVVAAITDPMPPATALAIYRSIRERLAPGKVEVVIVGAKLFEGVLFDRKETPTKPGELEQARGRALALDLDTHFKSVEQKEEKSWQEMRAKYGGDDPNPYEQERAKLAALAASEFPTDARQEQFSFVTLRDILLSSLRRLDMNRGKTDEEIIPAKDHYVRVFGFVGRPSDLPLILRYGGWNACPDPHVHAALIDHWNKAFGATLVFAGNDTLELEVAQPPTDPDDAQKLAWRQFLSCPDIVYQGVGSVDVLAKGLIHQRHWYFWWD